MEELASAFNSRTAAKLNLQNFTAKTVGKFFNAISKQLDKSLSQHRIIFARKIPIEFTKTAGSYKERIKNSIVPNVDKDSSDTDSNSEETGLRAEIGRQYKTLRAQTPTMTSPIGCSTAMAHTTSHLDPSGTPIRSQETNTVITKEGNKEGMTGKLRSKQVNEEISNKVRFELEPRISEKIKTAKRVGKFGGVDFLK